MLKRFYKSKYFEEVIGLGGLVYVVLLFVAGVFLVRFLANTALSSITPASITGSTIPQFEIDKAQGL